MRDDLPHLDRDALSLPARTGPPPRIALLYGSLRARSYSRLLVEEAARLLRALGAEPRIVDPGDLPLPGAAPDDHPAVQSLRASMTWSEGQVWCSPEHHGSLSAVFKAQLDWIPLTPEAAHPTRGKTLALLQVCGGAHSFNVVHQLRAVGRAMHMLAVPAHASVPQAHLEFDADGRMRDSPHYDRLVDVMEELVTLTLLLRDHRAALSGSYSARKASRPQ